MASKNKMQKKNKAVFTIISDRLHEDSSQECFGQEPIKEGQNTLSAFQFPLNKELQEIHQNPQTSQLSSYLKFLQNQVRSLSNDIQYEYHQARQTVLYLGQATGLSKLVSRKKIDDQFSKMEIIRKYDPKIRQKQDIACDYDSEQLPKDAGEIAIRQIKQKIQIQWESQLCEQIEKERKRLKQLEKKKQKQIQQIDKDFEKIMKKRKALKQQQLLLKSQQSMKSLHSLPNGIGESSNKTPKKTQKRNKMERKQSNRSNRSKNKNNNNSNNNQPNNSRANSIQASQIEESSSIINQQNQQNQHHQQNESNNYNVQNQILQFESNGLEINHMVNQDGSNHINNNWKNSHDQLLLKININQCQQNIFSIPDAINGGGHVNENNHDHDHNHVNQQQKHE